MPFPVQLPAYNDYVQECLSVTQFRARKNLPVTVSADDVLKGVSVIDQRIVAEQIRHKYQPLVLLFQQNWNRFRPSTHGEPLTSEQGARAMVLAIEAIVALNPEEDRSRYRFSVIIGLTLAGLRGPRSAYPVVICDIVDRICGDGMMTDCAGIINAQDAEALAIAARIMYGDSVKQTAHVHNVVRAFQDIYEYWSGCALYEKRRKAGLVPNGPRC